MKIRTSFVSNSSSSSFIISIHDNNDPCPCCHRKDPDLQDLIERRASNSYSDNTEMVHHSKDSVLEDLNERIRSIENEIIDAKLRKPEDLVYPRSQWSKQTWQEHIEQDLKPALKELQELKEKVEKAKGIVFECKVSYHDELIRDTIRIMEKGGRLTIILKENE